MPFWLFIIVFISLFILGIGLLTDGIKQGNDTSIGMGILQIILCFVWAFLYWNPFDWVWIIRIWNFIFRWV